MKVSRRKFLSLEVLGEVFSVQVLFLQVLDASFFVQVCLHKSSMQVSILVQAGLPRATLC